MQAVFLTIYVAITSYGTYKVTNLFKQYGTLEDTFLVVILMR